MADNEGSTSDNSSTSKEKTSSKKSVEHEATPAAAPPPPPPPKEKKSGGGIVPKIIAIVALLLAIVAVALSAVLTTYWWNWPWAVTTPALALGLTALILAFLKSDGAALTAGGVGVILAIGAIVWCAIDLAQCNSYQGALSIRLSKDVKEMKKTLEQIAKSGVDPILKAQALYAFRDKCAGQAFDWSYRKEAIVLKRNCAKEAAEAIYAKKKKVDADLSKRARYDGTDTYEDSPIYATHNDREKRKEMFYTMKEEKTTTARESLDKFCEANFEVEAFLTAREKCDAALEAKFKPRCNATKYKTYAFSVGKWEGQDGFGQLKKVEACQVKGKDVGLYKTSKFVLAMGGKIQFFTDLAEVIKSAEGASQLVEQWVISHGGSRAEAKEFARKAAAYAEKEGGTKEVPPDKDRIAKKFLEKFELERNKTKAADKLGELLRKNATEVEIEIWKEKLKEGYEREKTGMMGRELNTTEIAKHFAEEFRQEKKFKAVKKKLRELLKAKSATPEEIEEFIKHNRRGPDETAEKIAERMATVFLAEKKVETDLKAKGATEEEIDEYKRKVDYEPEKTAEEIADEVVKRFVKEKAALDEVKKQLREKGATEVEVEEYVQRAKDVLYRFDDDNPEEFVEDIVSQFERGKRRNEGGAEATDEEAPNRGDGPGDRPGDRPGKRPGLGGLTEAQKNALGDLLGGGLGLGR